MDAAHSDLLTRWQQLHFEERQATEGSHKADSLRNLLTQVQHAANVDSLLSPEAVNQLMYEYSDCYGTVVDSPLEQQGLDNYAEGALALAEGKKNESEQWQCSLDIDELMKVDFIQDFCNANKKAIQDSLPPGGETTRISIDTSHLPSDPTHPTKPTSLPAKPSERQSLFRSRPDGPVWTSTVPLQPRSNQPPEPSAHQPARGDFWTLNKRAQAGASDRETYSGSVEPAFSRPAPNANSNRRSDKRPRENEEENDSSAANAAFRTARQQLAIEQQKKYNRGQGSVSSSNVAYGTNKKSLGARRGINSKFIPPVLSRDDGDDEDDVLMKKVTSAVLGGSSGSKPNKAAGSDEVVDERLKNIDPKMIELITNEIMDSGQPVAWDDIAGLEFAKKTIKEIVVWPMLRPDIFTGLRGPPKGLLLFGPPGTGKTLIGKCIASQSKSTFFSISASSLTSKWVGEGEKMVRALFAVARVHQPAVIFIDEIDSLLSQRSDGENEASRRIKTEFLVQLDGATTGVEDRILVVGATNRPQEIDEAARRRFVKRLYIPLPENEARRQIVVHLLSQQNNNMTQDQLDSIAERTDGYSGSDMANLCREAALGPIRSMAFGDIENITADQVRPINFDDCLDALKQVRASVSEKDLELYLDWNKQYGSWGVGK